MRAGGLVGVDVAVHVLDVASGRTLLDDRGEVVLPTASVGKVLLLIEVARRLDDGTLAAERPLDRRDVARVGDSGLWQHLATDVLPLADAAALVGAVSDNLATNVLLHHVGLDAVAVTARSAGLGSVHLHDTVRDVRGPQHPATLSSASAVDLARLFARLHRGDVVSPGVSRQVLDWLALDADLSMVAAALGLDPLAHVAPDRGVVLRHKTGTDAGVRADAGVVSRGDRTVAYAVVARWDPRGPDRREAVLTYLREVGDVVASHVAASAGRDGGA